MKSSISTRSRNLQARFERVFSAPPQVTAYAPGRVDLLGSHTDYNQGFVLPVAIDLEVIAVGRAREDDLVRLWSEDFAQLSQFKLNAIEFDSQAKWSNYARGVISGLRQTDRAVGGADILLSGSVPIGSGLSSSAAVEMAVAFLLQHLFVLDVSPVELALIGQRAENEFVGVRTGIMDQFASRLGKKGHALFIDCRSMAYDHVPLPESVSMVIADTMKRRGLVGSEYDLRRSQCEEAAVILGAGALRDVSQTDLEARRDELPEVTRKRAEHVVGENRRVVDGCELLRQGDVEGFGRLMNESHDSARDLYEVSCRELEVMVESARSLPGVLGSRMAGAGFGGCTVSLALASHADELSKQLAQAYHLKTGTKPDIYICTSADGAGLIPT